MKIYNVVLLLLPMFIWSQNIKGHIENENQEPISESSIEINENKSIFYSDKDGNFSLEGISKFPVSIVIKKQDYQDYEITLENNEFLNIILKKDTVKSIAGVTIKANKPLLKR